MGKEHSTEMEAMKKNIEAMQDQMTKNIEAMQGQLTKMMEMVMNLQKRKRVAEDSSPEQLQNHEGVRHDLRELKVQVVGLSRLIEVLVAAEKVQCCKSYQTCFKQSNGSDSHDSEKSEVAPPGQPQSHPPSTGLTIPYTSTLTSIPDPNLNDPKKQKVALDRVALQNMEKKATESFKEYAQRWSNVASQIQLPLTDEEKSSMFLDTLKRPYFDMMIGNASQNFTNLVMSGELIESAIKSGRIEGDPKRGRTSGKKDGETQVYSPYYPLTVNPSPLPPPLPIPAKRKLFQDFENGDPGVGILGQPSGKFDYIVKYNPPPSFYESLPEPSGWGEDEGHFGPLYSPKQSQAPSSGPLSNTATNVPQSVSLSRRNHTAAQDNRKALREKPPFDPIPMSYTELLPKLIQAHLVAPLYLEPLKPPTQNGMMSMSTVITTLG